MLIDYIPRSVGLVYPDWWQLGRAEYSWWRRKVTYPDDFPYTPKLTAIMLEKMWEDCESSAGNYGWHVNSKGNIVANETK